MNLFSVLWLVLLIPSVTFHEFMHGWAAYKLGDPTAKNAGRLTMNPLKSIDPFGTILLPLVGFALGGPIFGYAKPVPYNPVYFKNLRQGEVIVGFAGPSANLLLAGVGAGISWLALTLAGVSLALAESVLVIGAVLATANLVLMFFNLIPIPPLDGSSIVPLFLPNEWLRGWYQLQRYSFVILIAVIFLLPMLVPSIDPIGWYFDHTAFALLRLILPSPALSLLGL